MKRYYFFFLATAFLINACSSNDDSKIKELEAKLNEQQEQLAQEKEQLLKDELEQKERELEELKSQNQKASNSTQPNFYARGKGTYPQASERRLSYEDIEGLSAWDLKIMRNEIFARHGYIFKTSDMIDYFRYETWYRPMYSDVSARLSAIERANVNYIKSFE